jgi:hypothetical protein
MMRIFTALLTTIIFTIGLINSPSTYAKKPKSCPVGTIAADNMTELPKEIKNNLMMLFKDRIADAGQDFLDSDVITKENRNLPDVRFIKGYRLKGLYIVFFETGYYRNIRSLSYRKQSDDKSPALYRLQPFHYFSGPICSVMKAIDGGVTGPAQFGNHFRP